MDIVKVAGTEAPMTTIANTWSNAHLIRIVATSNTLVTRAYANGVAIGTFSALGGQVTWAAKGPSETFAATANLAANATPVSFQS